MNDALEIVQALMCCACNNPDHHDAAAVLAAASGLWAEQLDAAKPRYDYEILGNHDADFLQLQADFDAQNDALAAALARVDLLTKDRDAGLEFLRQRDAARAELDNLRDRMNALADKWQDSEFRRKQPVLAYVGLDVAARDLTADREAFDREVARKGAEVGRMNAAIVRGSDDELSDQ